MKWCSVCMCFILRVVFHIHCTMSVWYFICTAQCLFRHCIHIHCALHNVCLVFHMHCTMCVWCFICTAQCVFGISYALHRCVCYFLRTAQCVFGISYALHNVCFDIAFIFIMHCTMSVWYFICTAQCVFGVSYAFHNVCSL